MAKKMRPANRKKCVICGRRTARVRVFLADGAHSDICGKRNMETGGFEPSRCLAALSVEPGFLKLGQLYPIGSR